MTNRKSSQCLRSEAQVRDVLRENLQPTQSDKEKASGDGFPHQSFTVKWAASALGKIGAKAMQAIPSLTEALNHEDMEVREMAAIALRQIA